MLAVVSHLVHLLVQANRRAMAKKDSGKSVLDLERPHIREVLVL